MRDRRNVYGRIDPVPLLAAIGFIIALVSVTLAVVAIGRSDGDGYGSFGGPMMGGMSPGNMGHTRPLSTKGITAASGSRGGVPLAGVKRDGAIEFELTAKPVWWNILRDQRVAAWSYNGIVPGPEIRVRNGQRMRVKFTNNLPEPTTVHWHGVGVPNSEDGVPGVTQDPIEPGASQVYEFVARPAGESGGDGTFFYHSHFEEDRQMAAGLYGALIIEPRRGAPAPARERTLIVSEWTADPASGRVRGGMPMGGMFPNYFSINGKSFPDTEQIEVKAGDRFSLRLINAGQFAHPLHLHGTAFRIVARDGHPTGDRSLRDTVTLESGERADISFVLPKGKWLFHCHIGHHLTNNGEGPGGLMTIVNAT
ncbi:MAG: copper oxidase [Solirubrobacterales bacterium]